ncbi:MAG: hypothetical protein AB7R89_18415 [Dehalococcoidia bacterium]
MDRDSGLKPEGRRCQSIAIAVLIGAMPMGWVEAAPPSRMVACSPLPRVVAAVRIGPNADQHEDPPLFLLTLTSTVLEDGRVRQAVVIDRSSAGIERQYGSKAVAALERWRFAPVERACRARISVTFRSTAEFGAPEAAEDPPFYPKRSASDSGRVQRLP